MSQPAYLAGSAKALAQDAIRIGQELRLAETRIRPHLTEAERAWSGSYIGRFARMYTPDLTSPSQPFDEVFGDIDQPGWAVWEWESFRSEIETRSGERLDQLFEEAQGIIDRANRLRRELEPALARFRIQTEYQHFLERLDETTKRQLGRTAESIAKDRLPSQASSPNYQELQRGIQVPHHLWFEAQVASALSAVGAIEQAALDYESQLLSLSAAQPNGSDELSELAQRWSWILRGLDRAERIVLAPIRLVSATFVSRIEASPVYRLTAAATTVATFLGLVLAGLLWLF